MVYGITETFFNDYRLFSAIPDNYICIGKNRPTQEKRSGCGIGFIIHNSVSVVDDNICNSKNDNMKRLWI